MKLGIYRLALPLGALLAASLPLQVHAADGEDKLLEQVRTGQVGNRSEEQEKISRFNSASDLEQQKLLSQMRAQRDAVQEKSAKLEVKARDNDREYKAKLGELRKEMGPNAATFGVLQNATAELVGQFRNSPTSLEYPDRDKWLAQFGEKMSKSSEIFTIKELEKLWFLLLQEIAASGKVVKLKTEVLGEDGSRSTREVVRVGKFGIISNDPEPAYLTWQSENQRASLLKRQPEGGFLSLADSYIKNGRGRSRLIPRRALC